jgi:anaerobic selenocysteine-containing dehydrogenase
MLEREDLNIVNIGLAAEPYLQFTPAVVEPQGERRPEWWICHRILKAMGRPSSFDQLGPDGEPDVWGRFRHMAKKGSGVDLDALRADPDHVVVLPKPEPGRFFEDQVHTADGRVDLCPPAFAPAIERAHELFAELAAEPAGTLKLITRRDAWMMNSWFRNLDRMQRRDPDGNPLWANPADLAARGLADGDKAVASNRWGAVEVVVRADDDLLPGVVSMAHGWGNARTSGMGVAQRTPGVNVNQLLPSGPGSFEPLSSQAHMTGIPVEVTAI